MIFDKARELGTLLLESDQAKVLEEAKEKFAQKTDVQAKFDEYTQYRTSVQRRVHHNQITEEELETAKQEINALAQELQEDQDLMHMLNAEEEFNAYVNQVMHIVKATIKGHDGCEGGCGGCGSK